MTRTFFQGANLLDGENPLQPGTTVVVEGERIIQVGGNAKPGAEDRVIDLAGKTLMPGMITCHFHSSYSGITIMPEPLGLEKPPGYLMLVAANNVRTALHCGFTGIVSAGVINDNIDVELKLAIEEGIVEGPRLVPGGLGLDTTGDYNDTGNYWWELGNLGAQRFCDGPDEFRKAVRQEVKRGVEIIKIFASGGHGVPEVSNTRGFTTEELRAIIEAAHDRGRRVRAHCAWRDMILECIREGIDVIDHGDEMDDECIQAMVEHGTFLCPSQFFVKQLLDYSGELAIATPEQMAPVQAAFDHACQMLPKANQAGVRMVVGDDYGIINLPHGRYGEELEFYVKSVGIPPLDVLRWATRNGAELMGRANELGTVEKGKLADLLVVDGDPSVDIGVLRDRDNLKAILKGGHFVKDNLS